MKRFSMTALAVAIFPSMLASTTPEPREVAFCANDASKVALPSLLLRGSAEHLDRGLAGAVIAALHLGKSGADHRDAVAEPQQTSRQEIDPELNCLALNIYHEARSEPESGQIAVAQVTLNRVASGTFPSSVCGVVKQGSQARHSCQFSWWCDGKSDRPTESAAWRRSLEIGRRVLADKAPDPTHGALYYHAKYVAPKWSRSFQKTAAIGRHLFYRPTQS